MLIVSMTLALAAALGLWRPLLGLAVLLGGIVPTSGLAWHLGLGNLPLPLAFAVGLSAGSWVRDLRRRRNGGSGSRVSPAPAAVPSPMRGAIAAMIVTITAAAIIGVLRRAPEGLFDAVDAGGFWARARLFAEATDLGAAVIATITALLGAWVFVVALRSISTSADQRMLLRSVLVGATVAVLASPLLWLAGGDPWLRPDRQIQVEGLVGLAQDQHAFGAYLVLLLGVSVGFALARARGAGSPWLAGSLAAVILVCVLMSRSRAALLGAAAVILMVGIAPLLTARRTGAGRRRALWLAVGAALAIAIVLVGVALFVFIGEREALPTGQGESSFLAMQFDARQVFGRRMALWNKALLIMRSHPLWGLGGVGFPAYPVDMESFPGDTPGWWLDENAHDYYLQVGADFGLPALAAMLLLMGAAWWVIWRGYLSETDPRRRAQILGIAAALSGFLLVSVASHPLLVPDLQAAYWGIAAIGVAMVRAPAAGERQ